MNKYSSSVVNNQHGNINKICWPYTKNRSTKLSKTEHALSCSTKSDDFVAWQKSPNFCMTHDRFFVWRLTADKICQLYQSSDIPLSYFIYVYYATAQNSHKRVIFQTFLLVGSNNSMVTTVFNNSLAVCYWCSQSNISVNDGLFNNNDNNSNSNNNYVFTVPYNCDFRILLWQSTYKYMYNAHL